MELKALFVILISTIFINNYVLSQILGLCPFLGVSRKLDSALGMGLAVVFVMAMASFFTFPIYKYILVPYDITYLRTIAFILVIAGLVQFVEMVIENVSPVLYHSLGIFLPLITTNFAILAVTFDHITTGYSLVESIVYAGGVSLGYRLAMVLLAGIRQRIRTSPVPKCLQGTPILFVATGLITVAFMGFAGMIK